MAMAGTLTSEFPLNESSSAIVRRCCGPLNEVLQRKFRCEAFINGVDSAAHAGPNVDQKPRFSAVLPSGVKLSVWKADLTSFSAHAVVNAANSHLSHGGGLALALVRAGGMQIQRESDEIIRKHGTLQTGHVVVTGAGNLRNCEKIIHAVGPELYRSSSRSEVKEAEGLLSMAIANILQCVKHHHFKSVAIPAISSGIFNFPLPLCADTIVRVVKAYYETAHAKDHLPEEVFLVNHDEPSVKEMERACRQQLQNLAPRLYSQVMAGKVGGGASREKAPNVVNIGKVQVSLRRGNIEEQMTDVIVNTTAPERKLSFGQISMAISTKAGPEMQSEIKRAKKNEFVVRTQGYKLMCKEVYHTFYAHRDQVLQTLAPAVLRCLQMAAQSGYTSIAFPAIGTGALDLSPDTAARIMTAAVSEFAKTSTASLDVHFVIFPTDGKTFEAFERHIGFLQSGSPLSRSPESFGTKHVSNGSRDATPKIVLTASCVEARREALQWLRELFNVRREVTIHNNFIFHLGEQDIQELLADVSADSVSIEERLVDGRATIVVRGDPISTAVAVVKVEARLCRVLIDFITEEELSIRQMTKKTLSFEKQKTDYERVDFLKEKLTVVKVEEVDNPALKEVFDHKKHQLKCSDPRTMYQLVPWPFIETICRVGFHAECAPPEDPAYGEGIYFAGTLKEAMSVWRKPSDEYLYFVEAEVLTGESAPGSRDLILPPLRDKEAQVMHDSVRGEPNISVIFSGYQALPKCVITCRVPGYKNTQYSTSWF